MKNFPANLAGARAAPKYLEFYDAAPPLPPNQ